MRLEYVSLIRKTS